MNEQTIDIPTPTPTTPTKRKPGRRPKAGLQDHFIREVRVQYEHSTLEPFKVSRPEDVASFLRQIAVDNSREHFFALYLDTAHCVASYSLIATGSVNCCPVHPREIYQRAILGGATAMIVAHNHPSGALNPSDSDWHVTNQLKKIGSLLSIPLLDHVIFSHRGEYSLRDNSHW